MILLNPNTPFDFSLLQDCNFSRSQVLYPMERTELQRIVLENNIKTMLDVGIGDRDITGLDALSTDAHYLSINDDGSFINLVKNGNPLNSKPDEYQAFKDINPALRYDMITARFVIDGMKKVQQFVSEAYKKLNNGGFFIITEYYIEPRLSKNKTWKLYLEKELELYYGLGLFPRITLDIPKFMYHGNFFNIEFYQRHISASSVGFNEFYNLIAACVNLYHTMDPEIFTDSIRNKILKYCMEAKSGNIDNDDTLLISYTIGKKS
jgi:2-polyprenyl-3-methyl-5-hydroxy-6-metoxy-1,4-benzoquinol methylase